MRTGALGAAAALILGLVASGCGSGSGRRPEMVIGSKGLSSGSFVDPRGLAVANDGSVFCVDMTGRVQSFDAEGRYVTVWLVPEKANGLPEGLAIDRQGNILVADTHYSRILKYSPDGEELSRFGQLGDGPGQMTYPLAVAVNSRGEIYVAEYGGRDERVQRYTSNGEYLNGWGSFGSGRGEFRRPSGLAVDSEDRVYVADTANHRVQRFSREGQHLGEFGREGRGQGELSYPYDLALTPSGTLVVCEYGNCRVSEFSLEGEFVRCWGGPGAAEGLFATPWCIAVGPEGRIFVADTKNARIQVFAGGGRR